MKGSEKEVVWVISGVLRLIEEVLGVTEEVLGRGIKEKYI